MPPEPGGAGRRRVRGPPKTAAGKRTIGMPSFVARSLAVHIDLYALAGTDGLVFPSADEARPYPVMLFMAATENAPRSIFNAQRHVERREQFGCYGECGGNCNRW